jgi:hypothetical protein
MEQFIICLLIGLFFQWIIKKNKEYEIKVWGWQSQTTQRGEWLLPFIFYFFSIIGLIGLFFKK